MNWNIENNIHPHEDPKNTQYNIEKGNTVLEALTDGLTSDDEGESPNKKSANTAEDDAEVSENLPEDSNVEQSDPLESDSSNVESEGSDDQINNKNILATTNGKITIVSAYANLVNAIEELLKTLSNGSKYKEVIVLLELLLDKIVSNKKTINNTSIHESILAYYLFVEEYEEVSKQILRIRNESSKKKLKPIKRKN